MKLNTFIIAVSLSLAHAVALAALEHEECELLFSRWAKQHAKIHPTPQERAQRLAIFTSNLNHSFAHQANSLRSYDLKMNEFGDLTNEEFLSLYTGYNPNDRSYYLDVHGLNDGELTVSSVSVPTDLDWRIKNKVTAVKNQGQCGSCWAFSAVAAIESGYAIDNDIEANITGSEQQLVDCSGAEGNGGCNGGWMDSAFKYVIKNGGLCTEAGYPYQDADGTCNTTCTKTLTISGYTDVPPNNSTALLNAVAIQPVSVALDAGGSDWQFYAGGILNGSACGTSLDHAVLIVGYSQSTSPSYWIVKNSWGTGWGDEGYIYIPMDDGPGVCGINMAPSYPRSSPDPIETFVQSRFSTGAIICLAFVCALGASCIVCVVWACRSCLKNSDAPNPEVPATTTSTACSDTGASHRPITPGSWCSGDTTTISSVHLASDASA